MRSVVALILAAGGSTRLGRAKQFLVFEGETLIRRIAKAARAANCDRVLIVGGDAGQRVRCEVSDLGVETIDNPDWQRGIGTSIKSGLAYLGNEVDAVVLLACDQPFAHPGIIRQLIAQDRPIAASGYAGTVGIPALFRAPFLDALRSLPDNSGAKILIERNQCHVAVVPFPEGAIDIDTAGDYDALTGRSAS